MNNRLHTVDNNQNHPLTLTEGQSALLSTIAGRSLSSLHDEADNGLLVFPRDFGQYGDRIGDCSLFEISGDRLLTGNMMGFVGTGDTMLKIGSRFDEGRNDFFVCYMLEKVMAINLFDLEYSTEREDIFDIVLVLFPYYLKRAMAQGLYREYRFYERNESDMRGVLDIGRHIRTNIPFTGKIAYRVREHSKDNNLTELVRHTIEYIRTKEFGLSVLSCDEDTKTCVSQIVEATLSYDRNERRSVISRNLRSRIHPYYQEYEPLRQICISILQHEEIKYGNSEDKVYGVIFDGAWLWEEYLDTILTECGIRHPKNRTGEGKIHLFKPSGGERYPDFIGRNLVLDAKYKRYAGSGVTDVGREDIAQIISYMYVQKAARGGFICPGGSEVCVRRKELEGYGGEMLLINVPISVASDYKRFKDEMAAGENALKDLAVGLTML